MSFIVCLIVLISGLIMWTVVERLHNRIQVKILNTKLVNKRIQVEHLESKIWNAIKACDISMAMATALLREHGNDSIEIEYDDKVYTLTNHDGVRFSMTTGESWGDVPEAIKDIEN